MKFRGRKLTLPMAIILILAAVLSWYLTRPEPVVYSDSVMQVPDFSGNAYVVIGDNRPEFSDSDLTAEAYEYYSPLDDLGRCGYAMACVGRELMPTEERESISHVKPTGWVQGQYDFVDGGSLYNRCHLIGFQLTGENANAQNLITGTRYCNVEGMLPFENMIADYVKETGNHVLYRVTPVFDGDNLLARGVQMEALSVEDGGDGICFHVYAYNAQPGVSIDYATGRNTAEGVTGTDPAGQQTYILNTNSKKFHRADCAQAQSIKQENKEILSASREELLQKGYAASGCCDP